MSPLSTFLRIGSAFALATGTADVLLGAQMIEIGSGISFPMNSAATVFADSQIRYLGGIWAGYGAMLWWVSNDLEKRRTPLGILGGCMVFGGIGRAIGGALHGFDSDLVVCATVFEIVVPATICLLRSWRIRGTESKSKH